MSKYAISLCNQLLDVSVRLNFPHLALGQLLSFTVSTTGMFTTFLIQDFGFNLPIVQCAFVYFLLLVASMCLCFCRFGSWRLNNSAVKSFKRLYALIAFCDANANVLIVYAYQFSDMPTIQLLMCGTCVPCVMLLSYIVHRANSKPQIRNNVEPLKRERWFPRPKANSLYTPLQYFSAGICLSGVIYLIVTNALDESQKLLQIGGTRIIGDAFSLLGVFLYAISNVGCEQILKSREYFRNHTNQDNEVRQDKLEQNPSPSQEAIIDYLFMLGAFGSLTCLIESCLFECVLNLLPASLDAPFRFSALTFKWRNALSLRFIGLFLGFGLTMLATYLFIPLLLFISSAAFLNLSLLTTQCYTLLWASMFFAYKLRRNFVFSFIVTILGAILYECKFS